MLYLSSRRCLTIVQGREGELVMAATEKMHRILAQAPNERLSDTISPTAHGCMDEQRSWIPEGTKRWKQVLFYHWASRSNSNWVGAGRISSADSVDVAKIRVDDAKIYL